MAGAGGGGGERALRHIGPEEKRRRVVIVRVVFLVEVRMGCADGDLFRPILLLWDGGSICGGRRGRGGFGGNICAAVAFARGGEGTDCLPRRPTGGDDANNLVARPPPLSFFASSGRGFAIRRSTELTSSSSACWAKNRPAANAAFALCDTTFSSTCTCTCSSSGFFRLCSSSGGSAGRSLGHGLRRLNNNLFDNDAPLLISQPCLLTPPPLLRRRALASVVCLVAIRCRCGCGGRSCPKRA